MTALETIGGPAGIKRAMRDDLKTLTDFRSLFEDDQADVLTALLLQLLEAEGLCPIGGGNVGDCKAEGRWQ
jgi:hypothetical protein